MQVTSLTEKINPGNHLHLYSDKEMSDDFYQRLRIMDNSSRHDQDNFKLEEDLKVVTESMLDDDEEEGEEEDDDDDDDDFSFVCVGEDAAAIAAEDAFSNGQIKAVFPLFDQRLLYGDESSDSSLPMRPPVKNVFVETKDVGGQAGTSSADEIAGPFCEWSSRKAVEASSPDQVCKKSNSTGFSKLWRLKELTARSNSDGRDAFVFLNSSQAPPAAKQPAVAEKKEQAVKVKKSGKSKKTAVSAHEVYLRSKAKEDDRRRSYLPYRPELMGFFTNVNGGLTKNVHPF